MTVLFTWLAHQTRDSVLLAWLFHGAINTLIFVNTAVDIVDRWWLSTAVYGAAALIVLLVAGRRREPNQHLGVDAEPTQRACIGVMIERSAMISRVAGPQATARPGGGLMHTALPRAKSVLLPLLRQLCMPPSE